MLEREPGEICGRAFSQFSCGARDEAFSRSLSCASREACGTRGEGQAAPSSSVVQSSWRSSLLGALPVAGRSFSRAVWTAAWRSFLNLALPVAWRPSSRRVLRAFGCVLQAFERAFSKTFLPFFQPPFSGDASLSSAQCFSQLASSSFEHFSGVSASPCAVPSFALFFSRCAELPRRVSASSCASLRSFSARLTF